MTIKELENKDKSFTEASFISKVDNTFIMLLTAIMTDDIERVSHKISPEVKSKIREKIDNLNNKNLRQMYDELNVKSAEIISIEEDDTKYIINVLLTSRYMDYQIDKTTGDYVSGINDHRLEKENYLTFEKYKNSKVLAAAKKCPGCGANIDYNNSGECPYCGSIFNAQDYDWILTEMR